MQGRVDKSTGIVTIIAEALAKSRSSHEERYVNRNRRSWISKAKLAPFIVSVLLNLFLSVWESSFFVLSPFHCLNVWGVCINKKGEGGGLTLTVRDLTGGGVGGGGFLRGVLRFRHSRGGWILRGGGIIMIISGLVLVISWREGTYRLILTYPGCLWLISSSDLSWL